MGAELPQLNEHVPNEGEDQTSLQSSTASLQGLTLSTSQNEKSIQIEEACQMGDVDALLRHAVTPLGFVNDRVRQTAWPLLLGCDREPLQAWQKVSPEGPSSSPEVSWEALPIHSDEHQVSLDVDRSFVYYPKGDGEKQTSERKKDLGSLITQVLRQHPYLCYFQGYHDIVQVLLLVLGRQKASDAAARLSILRIRDFMMPSLAAATAHLRLLPYILRAVEPQLERHLSQTQPFFALSATLTLYAHDIEEYGDIARLFDFFLAQPASTPIYFFANIVRNRKMELLEVEDNEPEMLHAILSKLPKPLDLEQLITQTVDLCERCPPHALPDNPWRRIDSSSVLKTAVDCVELRQQTLEQGETWFHRQERRLKREQAVQQINMTLWRHRRPIRSFGVAFTIVMLACWMRRDPSIVNFAFAAARRCQSLLGV